MHSKKQGTLYLLPNFLHAGNGADVLPAGVSHILQHTVHYIAESEKSLRALVKKLLPDKDQSLLQIVLLNEHTSDKVPSEWLKPLLDGHDMALVSDAGMPCIADPGHQVVRLCHSRNIRVVPVPGPSSILLLLVGSGFSGQQFTFHGYLPYDKNERRLRIQKMELDVQKTGYTQLFMDAPYRNMKLLQELIEYCKPGTLLCAGIDLTSEQEQIVMKPISEWKKQAPDMHKRPVMFAIGR